MTSTTTSRTTTTVSSTSTTTTSGGSPPASTGLIGTGFETTPDPAVWSVIVAPQDSSSATIDTTRVHSGTRSLKVVSSGSFNNHIFFGLKNISALGSGDLYGRYYANFLTAFNQDHTTHMMMTDPVAQTLRMGGQFGVLDWNRANDDSIMPDGSPTSNAGSIAIAANTWYCIEFYMARTTSQINTWVNGVALPSLTTPQSRWGSSFVPTPQNWGLGWEAYGFDPQTAHSRRVLSDDDSYSGVQLQMADANAMAMFSLIGSWVNGLLFALEAVLIVHYLSSKTRRPRMHQWGVASLFVADAICSAGICAQVYFWTFEFGPGRFTMYTNTLIVILLATYATAAMDQMFLTYLFYALTRNRVISAGILFLTAAHTACSYASGFMLIGKTHRPGQTDITFTLTHVGAIACAATDLILAAILAHTFLHLERTSAVRVSMHSLLRRLMILVVTSGVLVSSVTLISIVLLLRDYPCYDLFFFVQGRLYALTVLANLFIGTAARQKMLNVQDVSTPVTNVVFHDGDGATDSCQPRRSQVRFDRNRLAANGGGRDRDRHTRSTTSLSEEHDMDTLGYPPHSDVKSPSTESVP
ncbi:FAD/NAD(P)-binding domain-containing protein [Mycena kentingensis (nom. inval.)]|nr:FAD/NAD(P)-binding domain-containing protein [Mycena kentingensis (nom. inval.)]